MEKEKRYYFWYGSYIKGKGDLFGVMVLLGPFLF